MFGLICEYTKNSIENLKNYDFENFVYNDE
jgi:hypothetical protein